MSFTHGEIDAVLANRQNFLTQIGLAYEQTVVMHSDHQDVVAVVDETTPAGPTDSRESLVADALLTQATNLSLFLTTADCIPLSLYDPASKTIGLVHLSRHTFTQDLLEKTIETLTRDLRVRPDNLHIHLGPHITKDSYAFPLPLAETHEKILPYITRWQGRAHIDLVAATRDALDACGVPAGHISVSPTDTYVSQNHFSHRRSQETGEPAGRLATVVCLHATQE